MAHNHKKTILVIDLACRNLFQFYSKISSCYTYTVLRLLELEPETNRSSAWRLQPNWPAWSVHFAPPTCLPHMWAERYSRK